MLTSHDIDLFSLFHSQCSFGPKGVFLVFSLYVVPSFNFTDFGSGLLFAGKKERARAEAADERGGEEGRDELEEKMDNEFTQRY